jgi:hypothetical protein
VKRILQIGVIAALTVFFLWLFLRNANLREVGTILAGTAVHWVAIGLIANFGALVLRTIRWRTLLDPDDPPPFYATFFANASGTCRRSCCRSARRTSRVAPLRRTSTASPAPSDDPHRAHPRSDGILLMFVFFAELRWNEFSHDPGVAAWFYIVRAGAIASAVILTALWSFMIGLRVSRETIRRMHEWLDVFCRGASAARECTSSTRSPRRCASRSIRARW